jgi:hypothetical protein
MEDIKKAVDAVLAHSCVTIELMLTKALSGKKVKIRNANIGLGGSIEVTGTAYTPTVDLLVGKVESVIGCKTGNLSDGMLVTLLVEVDSGGSSKALLEVECFHRNIIVLDSE